MAARITTMDKELFAMATTRRLTLLATLVVPVLGCSSNAAAPTTPETDAGIADSSAAPVDSGPADTGSDDASDASSSCVYPAAPTGPDGGYGVEVGSVLPPTLQWQVYAPGATTPTVLKATDLYDCDGSKGINAIVFDSSGQWCIACQYEAGNIQNWLSSTGPNAGNWTALGVTFITLVIQTNSYEPASIVTADQWRTQFNLTDIYVGADPGVSFPTGSLPHNLLVDPRTMKVTNDFETDDYDAAGDDDAGTGEAPDPFVAKLAKKNQTQK
jgi:hypothetical protein